MLLLCYTTVIYKSDFGVTRIPRVESTYSQNLSFGAEPSGFVAFWG